MRVCRSLGYLLFAGSSLAELLTATRAVVDNDPTITAAPEIPMELLFKKQNNDRFIGWNSFSGSWYSQTCSVGGTYYQAGDYWRCCSTTSNGCNVPVGCFAGNLIYRVATSGTQTSTLRTIPCSSFYDRTDSICNTGLLYENSAGADARTNIACGPSPLNFSFYRVRPSDASSSTSSRSSTTPQSNSASTTSAGTSASSTDSPAADSPAPKKKKGGSKAWIAGAVAGPIIGLALLGALLFFCLRRKKKNKTLPPAPGPMQQQQQPTSQFNNSSTVPSYPASPNPAPAYYDTQQKQTALPYSAAGIPPGAPSPLQSHGPYAPPPPPPLSPLSQQQQQQQQQQWQQQYPQQGQNMYPSSPPPPPSTGSLSPQQQQQPVWNSQPYGRQSEVEARPFSAELDGSGAYQGVGGAAANR